MLREHRPQKYTFTAGPNHGSGGLFGYLTAVSAELTDHLLRGRKGAIMADIINQEQRNGAIVGAGSGRFTAGTNPLIADHQGLLTSDERGTD
jgi:hypothetical protein